MPEIPAAVTIQVDTSRGLSPEQARLRVADLILRVLSLMKKHQPRKALTRVTQLHALVTDYPVLKKQYPGVLVFLKFCRFYCTSSTKVKRKALVFLSLKAKPVVDAIFESLDGYLVEQRRLASLQATRPDTSRKVTVRAPAKVDHRYTSIGHGLENLKRVMPALIEAEEKRKTVQATIVHKKADGTTEKKTIVQSKIMAAAEPGVLSSDDAYIMEQAGKHKTRELAPHQSGIVRVAAVLTNTYVSELARRAVAVEYGMQRVMGSYMLMTEGLAAGISRFDDFGDPRPHDEIVAHAQRLVSARNVTRRAAQEDELGILFTQGTVTRLTRKEASHSGSVNTTTHAYFLLFDNRFIREQAITCKRWEFYRKPGTDEVTVIGN